MNAIRIGCLPQQSALPMLLSAAEAKKGRSDSTERRGMKCLDVEIRGLYPIHAAKSICGGTNSINKYICLLRYKRSAPKQGMVGASNFRTVHRYRFILRTWSNFTTLRGLVRSQSCLVRRNWTKQRKESARPEQRPTKTVIT